MPDKCPFCGSMDIHDRGAFEDFGLDWFYIYCKVCDARGPVKKTLDDAIKAWNARATSLD